MYAISIVPEVTVHSWRSITTVHDAVIKLTVYNRRSVRTVHNAISKLYKTDPHSPLSRFVCVVQIYFEHGNNQHG